MLSEREVILRQEISELRQELASLKEIVKSSIGNQGVQTDIRQTSLRQYVDTHSSQLATTKEIISPVLATTKKDVSAIDVVNLVNDFKESLIRKFKSITNQEFFIFSVIYSLEEQLGAVSYKDLSLKAGISESAVRDHVRGLIKKGVPILKEKSNNKINLFKIPSELKSVISLDSIIQIRNPRKLKEIQMPLQRYQDILSIVN